MKNQTKPNITELLRKRNRAHMRALALDGRYYAQCVLEYRDFNHYCRLAADYFGMAKFYRDMSSTD